MINTTPPGFPVIFSTFAVPCNDISHISHGANGIGIIVYFRERGNFRQDNETSLEVAIDRWGRAMHETFRCIKNG